MAKGKYKEWLEPEKLALIEGWARNGLSEDQIAHNIGITRKCLSEWKIKYGDILHALKKGKEVSDFEVENALFKSAMGYWVEETTTIEKKAPTGGIVVEKRTTRRHIPPSNTAQIFWLKNRLPDRWRDKRETEIEVSEESSGVIMIPAVQETKD